MRRLLPPGPPDPADPLDEVFDSVAEHGASDAGRPRVLANMVASVDGAYALDGRSGGLSSDADRRLFHVLRAGVDVVLVAAGTARDERYRRPTTPEDWVDRRARTGRTAPPLLCVVTRSGHLPADLPLLSGPGPVPLLAHPSGVDLGGLAPGIEPVEVGDDDVDLAELLVELGRRGARTVLCEGGPSLLGALHAADLIDELFVTTSPALVGGRHVGLLGATDEHLRRHELHRVLTADGFLFCTYRRRRGDA